MHAEILSLTKIFTGDVRFQIPMYQRPYVWTEEDQWEPLWNDIEALAERILAGEPNVSPHFMGAIVVAQQSAPVGDLNIRHVVDGQQRLTTLQLLLDAVEEIVRTHGREKDSHRLRPLILNNVHLHEGDDRFKVWPTNVDRDAFRAAMDDEAEVPDDFADQNIAQAHEVFKRLARAWADVLGDPDKCANRLQALTTSLIGHLQIAVIDLTPDDNAQAIFETLNARGTPLLVSDLVKNSLLQASESLGLDTDALYREHWEPFDHQSWRADVRIGRLFWPKIDVFIYQWLVMNLAREVPTQQMFNEFNTLVSARGLDPAEVMAELQRFARIYQNLDDAPTDHSPTGRFFYRWRTMQASALTPLLMWIHAHAGPVNDVTPILAMLESWLVRRMLCRSGTKGYSHFLHSLLKELADADPSEAEGIIHRRLLAAEAEGTTWPTDAQVRSAVLTNPIYRQLRRDRLRFVLEGIEDFGRDDKVEQWCPTKLTVEHVMPQHWSSNWPIGDDPTGERTLERNNLIHTLGNLSLVTNRLNPSLSNSAWAEKRVALREHSVLLLSDQLLQSDAWHEEAILERGRRMADVICEIWPRPTGPT
jgi:hypothetical protein